MYIRRYTSPNENFDYGYPHSNALLQFRPELERWKPHKAAHHPTRCDVINAVKLFPTVYCRILQSTGKFLMLSNQTSSYEIKCIRMQVLSSEFLKVQDFGNFELSPMLIYQAYHARI